MKNYLPSKTLTRAKVLFLLIFYVSVSFGQKTWTGATSTDWNTASNWNPSGVPSATSVLIPGGLTNYPIVSSSVASVTTISVNSSGTGGKLTIQSGGALTATGLITVNANGTLTVTGGTATLAGITSSGTLDVQGGTITSTVNVTISAGTFTQSGGTVWMATNTSTNPTDNLVITSGTFTQSGGSFYTKDFAPTSGSIVQNGSSAEFRVFHDWKPSGTFSFSSTAGTYRVSGAGGGALTYVLSTVQFFNVVVDAGVDPDFGSAAGSTLKIAGNYTDNGTTAMSFSNPYTLNFNGSAAQTITTSRGTNTGFSSITISNTSNTVSLGSNINMNAALTVNAGATFNLSTFSLGANVAPTSLVMATGTPGASVTGSGTLTLGGNVTVNSTSGSSGASVSCPIALGSATRTFTVANDAGAANDLSLTGIISSGTAGITKAGAGTMSLSGANNYSGTSTITAGVLQLGATNTLPSTTVSMNGGTLSTGATTGFAETAGTLSLAANSTIALGTGSHNLVFAASSGVSWTAATMLTITGWTGNYSTGSATAGKIFVGSSSSALTAAQLTQIRFYDGASYFAARILNTGEVVPTVNYITTGTISGSPFCSGVSVSIPFTYSLVSAYPIGTTTFTAQLSDASGSFSSPVTLGTIASDASGIQTISGTIPSNTPTGAGYLIRVISNSPSVTGSDNGVNLTINTTPANPSNPTSNSPQCNDVGVTLTRSGTPPAGETWYWQTVSLGTSTTDFGSTYNTLTSGTFYIRSRNNSSGCWSIGQGSLAVTVNPIPTPTFTVTPTATTVINTSVTYTTQSGQSNYVWSVPGVNGTDYTITAGGIGSSSNTVTLTWKTLGTKTVTVGYTSSGCPSVTPATNTTEVYSGITRYAVASTAWNLTSTWSATSGGTAGASIPVAGDIVFIGEAATARTVTIPAGYSAACYTLTIGSGSANVANSLTLSASNSTLDVSGTVTINRPSGGNVNNLLVNAGTLTIGGDLVYGGTTNNANRRARLTITTGIVTINGDIDFNCPAGVAVNAVEDHANTILMSGGAGTLNLKGAFIIAGSGGLYPGTSSTFNYNGSNAGGQSIPIGVSFVTYNNLNINNTSDAGATLSAAVTSTNVTGNITIGDGSNSSLLNTSNNNIVFGNTKTLTVSANSALDAGTSVVSFGTAGTVTINGTFKTADADGFSGSATTAIVSTNSPTITLGANSTVEYEGSTTQIITARNYSNLTSSSTGGRTLPSGGTIGIAGTFTPGSNSYTITGNTIDFNGSGSQTIPAFNYNNLTSSSSGARTLASSGTVGVAGTFTPGSNSYTITGSTINFNGSGSQTIPAFNYNNLTSSSSGARTLASSGTIGVAGVFTPGSNSYTITGSTIDFNGSGSQTISAFNYNNLTSSSSGARILASSGTIGVAGVFTPGANSYTISGSTINFNGSGSQAIPAFNYNNLTSSSSGARTLASVGTLGVAGTFTPGSNSFTISGSTIDFNGSGSQSIPAFNFNNLTINNSSGVTLVGDITINGTINLNSKMVTTGSNKVIIGTAGSITNANASGYIRGNLVKTFANSTASPAFTFPVGDASGYAPVTLTGTGTTTAQGTIAVSTTAGNLNTPAGSGVSMTNRVHRSWTALNTGITGISTYSAAFTYPSGEAGGTSANYIARYTNGTNWNSAVVTPTPTTTNATISGITTNSIATNGVTNSFILGECDPVTAAILSVSGASSICPGGSTTLAVAITGGLSPYTVVYNNGVSNVTVNSYTSGSDIAVSASTNTTYTLVSVTSAIGCSSNFNGTASVTMYPTTSITSDASPVSQTVYIGTNPYNLTIAATGHGTLSYQWKVSPGGANATGTGNNTDTYSPPTSGSVVTNSYYCVVTGGCGGPVTSRTVDVVFTNVNVWIGGGTNNWNTGSNWVTNNPPNSTSNAAVPIGNTPYPVLSANASVQNLQIDPGATVSINGNTLTINGTITGTGTLSGSSGSSLVMGAASSGTLYFTGGANTLKNLTINGGTTTLGNALNIAAGVAGPTQQAGVVTLASGATLVSNGNLTLKSNIYGTARIAQLPVNGSGTALATVSGNVTIERFISDNSGFRAWRLLSVPTKGSQTFKQAWQEGQSAMANGNPGYGTILTSTYGSWSANGYDAQTTAGNLLLYNNSTSAYSEVSSTNNAMQTTGGYYVYIRGDRSVTPSSSTTSATATILRTTGTLYMGDQAAVNIGAKRYCLVGNIYPSSVDFSLLEKSTGLQNAFYIWDPKVLTGTSQTGNSLGGYNTFSATNNWEPTAPTGSYPNGQSSTLIESGQAFFVYNPSSTTTNTIKFKEAAKVSGNTYHVFRPVKISRLKTYLYGMAKNGSTPIILDGNAVVFDNNYSADVDANDAVKMINTGENIGIAQRNQVLSVEGRPEITNADTVYFEMANMKQQQYQFEFTAQHLDKPGMAAYLEDSYLNTKTPVNLGATTTVTFTVDGNAGSSARNRFRIVFSKTKLPLNISKAGIAITPNPVEGSVVRIQCKSMPAGSYQVRILNNEGQLLLTTVVRHAGGNAIQSVNLPQVIGSGVYQLEMISTDKMMRQTGKLIISQNY